MLMTLTISFTANSIFCFSLSLKEFIFMNVLVLMNYNLLLEHYGSHSIEFLGL